MLIYFIRHGETDWNKTRRLQGQADIPLNEFGRKLAIETRSALKDIPFDLVYTSPLKRAKETAELVIGDRNVPIIEDKRIMEMGFGEYEGLCCKGEGFNIPDPMFRNFFQAPEKYQPPKSGESFEQLSKRLEDFLQELFDKKELQDKTILVSTHGAALCGMLRLIKKAPIEQFWGGGVHKNCAVTIVEVKDRIPKILEEAVTYYRENVADW
ncbi:MAG: histidine phosphatase family protein [Bariatricus sp.]|nr:histidine phosphatase family protein [Bariatricus sp.]